MFERIGKKIGKSLFAIALVIATPLSTAAWDLVPFDTGTTQIGQINALMAPIAPLVGRDDGSNTLINQSGTNNFSTASIAGNGSLTLLQQAGSNNRAVQAVVGQGSALMLLQGGSNNNVLQASQGDRNFQYVGVSGRNNDLAYIQVGNDLMGALDVTNSTNTTVLAIQTPGSNNYMMPSGLSGANDKLVIVVPGRMYVLDKNKL
jgi:hypothetical protein